MLLLPQLLELDRGQVAKRTVETFLIVFLAPALEQDLRFEQGLEEVTIQVLITDSRVERFDVSVLPG